MRTLTVLAALVSGLHAADVNDPALVAYYRFSEGQGERLLDHSGHEHHGRIVGARWEQSGDQHALRLDGSGDYVDFGDNPALKMTGDFTLLAWVTLEAPAYPDDNTNWTIFDCEAYPTEGTILRVDGAAATVMFRVSRPGDGSYQFGRARIANHGRYLIGAVRRGDRIHIIVDGVTDAELACGNDPVYGNVPFKISSPSQSFAGLIHEARVYSRALSPAEIAVEYWTNAGRYGKDLSRYGHLSLRGSIYADDPQILADVDFLGAMPLQAGERVMLAVAVRGHAPILEKTINEVSPACSGEVAFDMAGQPEGEYELTAAVRGRDGTARAATTWAFHWPFRQAARVPSPSIITAPPLPPPRQRLHPQVNVQPGGSFRVEVDGRSFSVTSSFSVPNSDDLVLAAAPPQNANVSVDGSRVYHRNTHYELDRGIRTARGRILVRDTITNLSSQAIGVIMNHRLAVERAAVQQAFLAGWSVSPPMTRSLKTNPTAFLSLDRFGIGFVALDDVLIVQSQGSYSDDGLSLGSHEFALNANASYTSEWAVYVNSSGDYYDLVNDVRADEQRNGTTVQGAWVTPSRLMYKRQLSDVPPQSYFDVRRPAYFCIPCLSWCEDDPTVSLEGIEFIAYPKERLAVRRIIDAVTAGRPHLKTMFHVAPNLYATNQPETLWPDSRIIGPDGRQTVYAYNYEACTYFTKERIAANWRWWSYYPALDNAYGKALLDSVDAMMNDMGASGVFIDGALWDYGGAYSYDRFDGHTADIDPATKTITRLKTAVPLVQQHAIAAWGREVMERGGVVVANNALPTRTIASQPFIFDKEVNEGPQMHLLPTPCTLGNPAVIRNAADVYADILAKLHWGTLYFFYGEPLSLQHESPAARMYPITVTDIRSGCVSGKERIVTMRDGVFGWPNDIGLHLAYRYDRRGRRIPHAFVTTIDASGARTAVDVDDREMAIVVKLPVAVQTTGTLNAIVTRCDEDAIEASLHGNGPVRITDMNGRTHDLQLTGERTIQIQPGVAG